MVHRNLKADYVVLSLVLLHVATAQLYDFTGRSAAEVCARWAADMPFVDDTSTPNFVPAPDPTV